MHTGFGVRLADPRTSGRRHLVVHVAPCYPPRLGGMERVVQAVAELLAERHDVEVVTTTCGSDGAPPCERAKGVRIRRFRGLELAHTPLSPGMVVRLLALPRRAVVHAHVAQAFLPEMVWLTSSLRRRRYVIHFHLDVDASGRCGVLLPAYKRFVLGPVLRRAAAVVALSPAQADFLTSHYRIRRDRVALVPNGVDRSLYHRPDLGSARQAAEPLRLLFVGRLDAQKNIIRLLDAMTHVSAPVDLVLVGEGEQRDLIEERLRTLGLRNVRLVGAQAGAELLAWYRWAEAFVLPSDKEGMPLVLLEAMASGLAIISTDVPGSRELVDGVGLLVDPRPEALGDAIQRVAADPELCAKLASTSAERSRSHSWNERIVELEHLYDRVAQAQ
jgi:glycosyltransferase involved in cell wall biosynthesis